jgi:hypothetical protein
MPKVKKMLVAADKPSQSNPQLNSLAYICNTSFEI